MTTFKVILGTGVCDHVIFWKMMDFFDINSDRVHLMWSIQSNGLPCMYPIYHGRCGMGNTDFGHWSCRSFNEFLSKVRSGLDTPDVHHGIYQVDFWPSSMAPSGLKGCYSANC
mmetsp:Transcript_17581/g.14955  ORF Transcript_17581/g.14955 Transcript_17581/m.14955 type:complete len:113 (+) Transcript_17581:124-462(+)